MDRKTMGVLGTILWAGLTSPAGAMGTSAPQMQESNEVQSQPEMSLYEQGLAAHKAGDFAKAEDLFTQALDRDPYNADTLNMLAHCERKLGKLDEAIAHYQKALRIRPQFPEAREYLGETYLAAALAQLDLLRGYGDSAKEELEDLTDAFKDAFKKIGS